MSVVYLSGPISLGAAATPEDIAAFSEAFAEQSFRLRDWGWEVIDPCECEQQPSWEAYMRLGITAVCRADVVAVLPRWLESRGAVLEVFVARALGIPVVAVEELAAPPSASHYTSTSERRAREREDPSPTSRAERSDA